jgi:hypothetical protein
MALSHVFMRPQNLKALWLKEWHQFINFCYWLAHDDSFVLAMVSIKNIYFHIRNIIIQTWLEQTVSQNPFQIYVCHF